MSKKDKILVLTGAGISADSGLATFRDSGGLWENHAIEDVATPEAFAKDPVLVWTFYKQRYQQALSSEPNQAHIALAKFEEHAGNRFHVITQNVDGLHKKAGNHCLYEMHGSLFRSYCTGCGTKYPMSELEFADHLPHCPKCDMLIRPDIVWFGEIPYFLYEIENLLKKCDVFIIVGTSGSVYPAAGFAMTAKYFGAKTIAVNLDPPDNRTFLDEFYQGKASEILPSLLDSLV